MITKFLISKTKKMSENKTVNNISSFTLQDSEIANDLLLLNSLSNNTGNINANEDGDENIIELSDEENENSENIDGGEDEVVEDEEEEYLESETELLRSLMTACRIGDVNEVKRCISTNRVDINQHDPKSIYGVSWIE